MAARKHSVYTALQEKGTAGREVARYIGEVAGELRGAGIEFDVYRIRPVDLRNPAVIRALRGRGIENLPAVLADGRALVGLRSIRAYYGRLLERAREPREDEPREGDWPDGGASTLQDEGSPEGELEDFLRHEMMNGHRESLGGRRGARAGPATLNQSSRILHSESPDESEEMFADASEI